MSDEPIGFAPPPPPPPLASFAPAPKRRAAKIVATALVVVVVVVGAAVVLGQVTKPKGPPSTPEGVRAKGSVCTPPDCQLLAGAVALSWSTPTSGSPVTGYDVYRDNVKITNHPLAATTTSFDDHDTVFGVTRNYQVLAHSAVGDSAKSAQAQVKIPLPPERFAQLAGVFTVRLTVQRASNLGKADGLNQPAPGDTTTETWQFLPTCASNTGPCSVKMLPFVGVLHPHGRAYDGSGHSATATCLPTGTAPTTDTFHVVPTRASLKDFNWVYTSFTGTRQVSFSCPNALTSSATFSVTGKFTSSAGPSVS